MKKRSSNKSQAGLITTIILIMVVLVSIVIVWNVVFYILNSSSSQTGIDQFSNTVTIESVKLLINGDLEVKVKKGSGNGTINSLQFNIFDSAGIGHTIALNNTNLNTLETKTYILNASNIKANNKLKSVSVYPVLGSKMGMEAPAYDSALNKDSSGNLIPEIPTNPSSIGLVSWWKFDGDMQDNAGNNHGSCTSCPNLTTDNHGNANSAYNFNGIDNTISLGLSIPNIANYGGIYGNSTLIAWVKPNSISKFNNILYSAGGAYYFGINTVGLSQLIIFNGTAANWPTSNSPIQANIWSQVAFVFEGGKGYQFYKNGSLDKNISNSNFILNNFVPGSPAYIGRMVVASNEYFNGSIENIMIFNKSLNSDEIKAIYNNQK